MFKTPKEMGLSQKEIDVIVEKLWKEEKVSSCPYCGVEPGEKHKETCDIARCTICEGQKLSCDCEDGEPTIWSGIWPGVKECYEQKLICFDTRLTPGSYKPIGWCFDLNKLGIKK